MSKTVAVTGDLIFRTKIESTARAVDRPLVTVATVRDLSRLLDAEPIGLVLVDMNLPDDTGRDAVAAAATHATQPKIVAFMSHVQHEQAEAARQAGAHQVMARSAFSAQLPDILAS